MSGPFKMKGISPLKGKKRKARKAQDKERQDEYNKNRNAGMSHDEAINAQKP